METIGYIGDNAPAGRECGDTASQGRGKGREREKKNRLWGTLAIASRSPRNDSSGPQAHQQVWMTPMLQLGRVGLLMEVGCNTSVSKRSMERETKILQIGWRKIRYRSARPPHRPISRLHNSGSPAPSDVRQLPDLVRQYPGLSSTLCRQPSYEYGRSPVPTRIRAARIELRLASEAVTLAPLGTHDATALFLFMAGLGT